MMMTRLVAMKSQFPVIPSRTLCSLKDYCRNSERGLDHSNKIKALSDAHWRYMNEVKQILYTFGRNSSALGESKKTYNIAREAFDFVQNTQLEQNKVINEASKKSRIEKYLSVWYK